MSYLDKYIKATKNAVIKSGGEEIEEKILQRISNVSEEDKKLIDERFLDYLKKSNSRLYIFTEWILNNPEKLSLFFLGFAAAAGIAYVFYRNYKSKTRREQ